MFAVLSGYVNFTEENNKFAKAFWKKKIDALYNFIYMKLSLQSHSNKLIFKFLIHKGYRSDVRRLMSLENDFCINITKHYHN